MKEINTLTINGQTWKIPGPAGDKTPEGGEIFNNYERNEASKRGMAVNDCTEAGWRGFAGGHYTYADFNAAAFGRLVTVIGPGAFGVGLEMNVQPVIGGVKLATAQEVTMHSTEIPVNVSVTGTIMVGDFICLYAKGVISTDCRKVVDISEDGKTITLDYPFYEPLQPSYEGVDQDALVFPVGTMVRLSEIMEITGNGAAGFGCANKISGSRAFGSGEGLEVPGAFEFASGKYNDLTEEYDANGKPTNKFARVIGNGYRDANGVVHRSNCFTIDWDGNVRFAGKATGGVTEVSEPEDLVPFAQFAALMNSIVGRKGSNSSGVIFNIYEGANANIASAPFTIAGGWKCRALATCAIAWNTNCESIGESSWSQNIGNTAVGKAETVRGKYNNTSIEYDENGKVLNKYADVVGNGAGSDQRSNAYTLDWDGNAWYAGAVETDAVILRSSTPGSTKKFKLTVDDSGALSVAEV